MAKNSGKQTQIGNRRLQVARLYHQGFRRQVELAERVGVNRSTISRDLKVLREEWQASARAEIQDTVAEVLDEVQNLKREYWEAWIRSQEKGKGDPRYLAGVQWCITKVCELLVSRSARSDENGRAPLLGDVNYPEYQRQLAEELEEFEQEHGQN